VPPLIIVRKKVTPIHSRVRWRTQVFIIVSSSSSGSSICSCSSSQRVCLYVWAELDWQDRLVQSSKMCSLSLRRCDRGLYIWILFFCCCIHCWLSLSPTFPRDELRPCMVTRSNTHAHTWHTGTHSNALSPYVFSTLLPHTASYSLMSCILSFWLFFIPQNLGWFLLSSQMRIKSTSSLEFRFDGSFSVQ